MLATDAARYVVSSDSVEALKGKRKMDGCFSAQFYCPRCPPHDCSENRGPWRSHSSSQDPSWGNSEGGRGGGIKIK